MTDSVFEYLLAHPECTRKELAKHFLLTLPTVRYHLKKLEDAGLIRQKYTRIFTKEKKMIGVEFL